MSNLEKNASIKKSLAETKIRRQGQDVKVFEIKIDASHLSKEKERKLELAFVQAKWIYNYCLDSEDMFSLESKEKKVPVNIFNKETGKCDIVEWRDISLGSQIKQSLYKQSQQNVINLAKAKAKGLKVGKLKFKKEVNRIHLKQFGTTYKIKNNNYISIQGLGKFKVLGLNQILTGDYEISCADLIKKPSGYYFKIVTYSKKEYIQRDGEIGIDMGIKDTVILSSGEKYNYSFPIPEKLKSKQRRLSKMKKGSRNYVKQLNKIKKDYEKLSNKKNDAANKFVSDLKQYKKVVIQDENLSGWASGFFGKTVSTSILGRIKSRIRNLPTSVMIDRYLPTTKICPKCHARNKLSLSDREYSCSCGFSEDRDIKSAKTILCLGNKEKIHTSKELRSLPVEDLTSVFKDYVFENKLNPLNQEAPAALARGSSPPNP